MVFSNRTKALFQLHFAVVLFGFTAILGKLITISALMLVWWRVLITCISLFLFLALIRKSIKLEFQKIKILLSIGAIIAVHWLTFYGSVKLSNSSITLLCMATTSFFASLIEPIFFKKPFQKIDIVIGCLIVPIMALIAKDINSKYLIGALVGLSSAFLAAFFSVLNKKYIEGISPIVLSFWEILGVLILTSLILPFYFYQSPSSAFLPPDLSNWIYILILALLCTTVAWVLSLRALVFLSAFESTLVINLEPVYGILLAAAILHEHKELNTGFYIGGSVILFLVLAYPVIQKRMLSSTANTLRI